MTFLSFNGFKNSFLHSPFVSIAMEQKPNFTYYILSRYCSFQPLCFIVSILNLN